MPPAIVPQIVLPQSCATCFHFDGDGFCTLPESMGKAFVGAAYIRSPKRMVCDQHVLPEKDEAQG